MIIGFPLKTFKKKVIHLNYKALDINNLIQIIEKLDLLDAKTKNYYKMVKFVRLFHENEGLLLFI